LNNEFDDGDFDSLLNLDAVGETFTFDDTSLDNNMSMNFSGGFEDVDWLGTGDAVVGAEAGQLD
jgi:hypothetical protein